MVPIWIFDYPLKPADLKTWIALSSYCSSDRICWPKASDIAERAHISEDAVHHAIPRLRALKLLDTAESRRPDGSVSGLVYTVPMIDPRVFEVTPRPVDNHRDSPGQVGQTNNQPPPARTPRNGSSEQVVQTNNPPLFKRTRQEETKEETKEQTNPPTPRADSPATAAPQAVPGRGRNPEPEPHATAAAFVSELATRVPQLANTGPADRSRLTHVVADALTRGVPLPAIADAATVDLSGLDHPAAGLAARIRRLEPPPPPERPMPPWCGRCDKNRRMDLDEATDQLVPCRRCHPDSARRR